MFLKTLNKFSAQTLNPMEVAVCKQSLPSEIDLINQSLNMPAFFHVTAPSVYL